MKRITKLFVFACAVFFGTSSFAQVILDGNLDEINNPIHGEYSDVIIKPISGSNDVTIETGSIIESLQILKGNGSPVNLTIADGVTIGECIVRTGATLVITKASIVDQNTSWDWDIAKGGSIVVEGQEGSFRTLGQITVNREIVAGQWNFMGLPNSETMLPFVAANLPNLWALEFDYSTNNWSEEFLHGNNALPRGTGIFVWTDTTRTLTYASATHTDGELTVQKDLTAQNIEGVSGRWMALSNPYLGTLNIAEFLEDNSSVIQGGTVYVYDGTAFNSDEIVSGDISVGQGFFVNMTDTENAIAFKPSQMKYYPSATPAAKASVASREYVKVSVSTDGYKVPVMICQNSSASQEYDIFDANKMFGSGNVAEPYFVTEGINLCKEEVATMPYYATMNIKSGEARTVEIVADAIPEGYSATLIDGDEEIELTEGMVYTTDIASGENAERFKLLIGEKNVSLESAEAIENLIQVSNIGRRVNISAQGAIEAEVYNALGQKVYVTTDHNFTLDGVSAGAYIIKVSNGNNVKSAKIIVQ